MLKEIVFVVNFYNIFHIFPLVSHQMDTLFFIFYYKNNDNITITVTKLSNIKRSEFLKYFMFV